MRTAEYTDSLTGRTFTAEIVRSKLDKQRYNVTVNGTKLGWLCKEKRGWSIRILPTLDALTSENHGDADTLEDGAWAVMLYTRRLYEAADKETTT
jgi:hypothetical protein